MRVSVAIPCYNEAPTIGKVVRDFRTKLPEAQILVCDNDSTDSSAADAERAGAKVIREDRRGKGFAIQALLGSVEGDVCVLVDGDDTYFAEDVHALLAPVVAGRADMVVGNRLQDAPSDSLTELRRLGNRLIPWAINRAFETRFTDVLSGYRALSRNFLESVPLASRGFEIETELALGALEGNMRIEEVPVRYQARPPGSVSKLKPLVDGCRILKALVVRLRRHRPSYFFGLLAAALLCLDLAYAGAWGAGLLPWFGPRSHGLVVVCAAAGAAALVMVGRALRGSAGTRGRVQPPAVG